MPRASWRYFGVHEGELLPVAVFVAAAVFIYAQGLGILRRQPRRRRGGRRAEHDDDVVGGGLVDRVIEPDRVVFALFGLHGAPGKLADADQVDVRSLHLGEVGVPLRLGPLLRIPGRAEQQRGHVGIGSRLELREEEQRTSIARAAKATRKAEYRLDGDRQIAGGAVAM